MDFLNDINKSTIIVCNSCIKKDILKEKEKLDRLIDIKLMSFEELIKHYYFDYDEQSIYYLMNKYNIKYDIAKIYLKNLYYVESKEYNDEKLDNLLTIKEDLISYNLLKYDNLFVQYLKSKDIIFYNYNSFNKFQIDLINKIENITNVMIIKKQYSNYKHNVYEFNNIDEEIEYVAYKISELIYNGIEVKNIKITNLSSEYYNSINKIFDFYNLKINLKSNESIYSSIIVNKFLNLETDNILERLTELNSLYKLENNTIYNQLVIICNKYTWSDSFNNIKELFIQDLKMTKIKNDKYSNQIDIIDYQNDLITDDQYIFMLNFNQSAIPVIYKDEDYIPDKSKVKILLNTTLEKNIYEKENAICNIKNIKNLIITYKLKTPFQSFYKSNLVDDLKLQIDKVTDNFLITYSEIADKINLSKKLDNLLKYGFKEDNIDILYNNYNNINYLTYNNKFNGIKKVKLYEYLNNKLCLSYSSMDNYYKCAFRYYLTNILKIDIYEETFKQFIGSLFHHILEIVFKEEIDVDEEVDKYIIENKKMLEAKEIFFINKLKEELKFIINTIKKQMEKCSLNELLTEEEIVINKEKNIKVTFKGYVDKILYKKEKQNTIIALIDYKTGNTDINLKNNPYGLSLQLPVYIYLAKNVNRFDNVEFAGFYLQKILNNEINIDKKNTYVQLKSNNLKLDGYSNSNKDILEQFDNEYMNSTVIKSMSIKNDGDFSNFAKVLTTNQIDNLSKLVDKKIDEAINNIESANFDINPKNIGYSKDSLEGCKYCKYKDICFRKEEDIVNLPEIKDLSFLGGDIDA